MLLPDLLTLCPIWLVFVHQVLFMPLLTNIGLRLGDVKTSALMKKLGCDLSIKLAMPSFRVDIVDSIHKKRHKGKARAKKAGPQIFIKTNLDTPAFLCDTFSAKVSMKDVVNFEDNEEDKGAKFAFNSLIAKPTTMKVNFLLNVMSVNQHVNMSLLRLIYQFVSMIENVNDTRAELKGLTSIHAFKGHRKQDSKGSSTDTAPDTLIMGQPEFPNLQVDEVDTPVVTTVDFGAVPTTPVHVTTSHPGLLRGDSVMVSRPDTLVFSGVKELESCMSTPELVLGGLKLPDQHHLGVGPYVGAAVLLKNSSSYNRVSESTTSSPRLKSDAPRCWKTLYALLDLYSIMPEPKTLNKPTPSRLSIIDEELDHGGGPRRESFKMKKIKVTLPFNL